MRMKMIASVDENNAIGNGGELLISSKQGEGTEVRIILPIVT